MACRLLGYTRMWSIHPAQIRPIVDAFAPTTAEVDQAVEIITAAQAADWAPIRHRTDLARPRQLPLLLAGHRAGAPHLDPGRPAPAGRIAAGLVPMTPGPTRATATRTDPTAPAYSAAPGGGPCRRHQRCASHAATASATITANTAYGCTAEAQASTWSRKRA